MNDPAKTQNPGTPDHPEVLHAYIEGLDELSDEGERALRSLTQDNNKKEDEGSL